MTKAATRWARMSPDKEAGTLVKRASYLSVVETSPDVEEITQDEFGRRCARILDS